MGSVLNVGSLVSAVQCEPRPGQRILDMCAAPGGKTAAIAQLMEDQVPLTGSSNVPNERCTCLRANCLHWIFDRRAWKLSNGPRTSSRALSVVKWTQSRFGHCFRPLTLMLYAGG